MRARRTVTVVNRDGLHARSCTALVTAARRRRATLRVEREDGVAADGRSIFDLMTLHAARGTRLTLVAEGDDAEALLDDVEALFRAGFGEGTG